MKRILFSFIAVFLLAFIAEAQTDYENFSGDKYFYKATNTSYLNTTGSVYTEPFTLSDQDAFNWTTYQWSYYTTATVPTTGTIKARLILQRSFETNSNTKYWTNVDTISFTGDTLSTHPKFGKNQFGYDNGLTPAPWYRWKFEGITGNSDSVTIVHRWYNGRRDENED